MAGTVMHLVIADRLLEQLNIQNPALFYCGNLAPDAIMGHPNYKRDMKTHTHFKDGQKPFEFRIKDNQDIYFERLMDFADTFLNKQDINYELYLGYIVHILVDELYLLNYYEDFLKELESQNISFSNMEFAEKFISDVDEVDWELVRNYEFSHPMPDILLSENEYEIPGWIENSAIRNSKNFIIHKNFVTHHDRQPLKVTTHKRNADFIEYCVEKIPNMLIERFDIV